MAWSTRALADLAGVSVKTVRYYHAVGLLPEPQRRSNGYKQYGAAHLVRLLRIRRLVDLGIPLARIGAMVDDPASGADALRALDAELGAQIERLQRTRDEVAVIIEQGGAIDVPEGFGEVAGQMNAADRTITLLYARVYDEPGIRQIREMFRELGRTALDDEFDGLADDADESTREALAVRYAPYLADIRRRWAWVTDPMEYARYSAAEMQSAVIGTLLEVYSVAQLDVLARAHRIVEESA